jgi:hypothetical protein
MGFDGLENRKKSPIPKVGIEDFTETEYKSYKGYFFSNSMP